MSERLREKIEFARLLDASSIGETAWIDCRRHGRQARDPDTDDCILCSEAS